MLPGTSAVIHSIWYAVLRVLNLVQFFATPWTVARQALLSMGFSRPECWSGLPFHSAVVFGNCRSIKLFSFLC